MNSKAFIAMSLAFAIGCEAENTNVDAAPRDSALDVHPDASALDAGPPSPLRPVASELPGVVLGFWGSAEAGLWAFGGPVSTGDGGRAMVLRWQSDSRWENETIEGPTLWWGHGFSPTDIWAVGERGAIAHYDGSSWTMVEGGDRNYTLFGIWGAAADDVWTVGGYVDGSGPSTVLHFDGTRWQTIDIGRDSERLFKVWGTSTDNVWVVGDSGDALHFDGAQWVREEAGSRRLVTVYGRAADDVYAVGGLGRREMVHYDGSTWEPVEVGNGPSLMGLSLDTSGATPAAIATGNGGVVLIESGSRWVVMEQRLTANALHTVYFHADGHAYLGGGNFFAPNAPEGIILRWTR